MFPVQIDRFTITRTGDRILHLHTYEEYAEEVSQVTNKPMGTEYMLVLMETKSQEYEDFKSETPDQTRDRFWKQFHALITEVSVILKEKPEIFKKTIKDTLKKEGKIKDSTKELTVEQLANEIIRLKNYKNKLNGKN